MVNNVGVVNVFVFFAKHHHFIARTAAAAAAFRKFLTPMWSSDALSHFERSFRQISDQSVTQAESAQ